MIGMRMGMRSCDPVLGNQSPSFTYPSHTSFVSLTSCGKEGNKVR